jgi:YcxB-like protein
MHIEYQISEDDFIAARQFSTHSRTLWKKFRLWLIRAVGLVFVVVGGLLLTQPSNKAINILVLGYGIFLCFFSLFTKFQSKTKFRRMTQLHGRYLVDLDVTGIHYISPSGETRMEWKVFGSFAEDASSFVLVQRGSTIFMPIPKRELSPPQIIELRTLLQAHLPGN